LVQRGNIGNVFFKVKGTNSMPKKINADPAEPLAGPRLVAKMDARAIGRTSEKKFATGFEQDLCGRRVTGGDVVLREQVTVPKNDKGEAYAQNSGYYRRPYSPTAEGNRAEECTQQNQTKSRQTRNHFGPDSQK